MNIKDKIAAVKNKGVDMTQATKGGGDYVPPAEGFVRLRLVGYFETGKHKSEYKGQPKINNCAQLVFELSGPKHVPRVLEDGTKVPLRITENVKISLNEKARFFQLFTAMNYDKDVTHIAELLGRDFVAEIEHKKEGEVVYANLKNIRKPFVQMLDAETQEPKDVRVNVDPPLTELKLFLWDFADAEMWDSIYIDGEYPEKKDDKGKVIRGAKSKNVIQEKIMSALNWKECPVYGYATAKAEGNGEAAQELERIMEQESDLQGQVKQDADELAGIA